MRFSQSLSSPLKQTSSDFKIFLKEALGHNCPPSILNRQKWGFDTPLRQWVGQPELFECIRSLPEGMCVEEGLLSADGVRAITSSPEAARNAARKVWNLLVLEVWMRIRTRLSPPTETLQELLGVVPCLTL